MDQTTTDATTASKPENWLGYEGLRNAHERAYVAAMNLGEARRHLMVLQEMTNDVCEGDEVAKHLPAIDTMILELITGMSINREAVNSTFTTPWRFLTPKQQAEARQDELAEAQETLRADRIPIIDYVDISDRPKPEGHSDPAPPTENPVSSTPGSPSHSVAG